MSDADKAPEKAPRGPRLRPATEEERQLARFNAALEEQYRRKAFERAYRKAYEQGFREGYYELAPARLLDEGYTPGDVAALLGIDTAEVEAIRDRRRA